MADESKDNFVGDKFNEMLSNIAKEYHSLDAEFGKNNYTLKQQSLIEREGKFCDEMVIELLDGTVHTRYFPVNHIK